jgi:hypothetical protein
MLALGPKKLELPNHTNNTNDTNLLIAAKTLLARVQETFLLAGASES